jgi:hypothetical protein
LLCSCNSVGSPTIEFNVVFVVCALQFVSSSVELAFLNVLNDEKFIYLVTVSYVVHLVDIWQSCIENLPNPSMTPGIEILTGRMIFKRHIPENTR